jgi:hypothetical protein
MTGQGAVRPAASTAVPAIVAILGSFCGTLVTDALSVRSVRAFD